jgi:excisionase family DNA binding protein
MEHRIMSMMSTGLSRDERNAGTTPLAVSVRKAARLLDVGQTTMWKLIGERRVETIRIGKKRLIVFRSLEKLLLGAGEEAP